MPHSIFCVGAFGPYSGAYDWSGKSEGCALYSLHVEYALVRGVGGMLPPGKILQLHALRSNLRAFNF